HSTPASRMKRRTRSKRRSRSASEKRGTSRCGGSLAIILPLPVQWNAGNASWRVRRPNYEPCLPSSHRSRAGFKVCSRAVDQHRARLGLGDAGGLTPQPSSLHARELLLRVLELGGAARGLHDLEVVLLDRGHLDWRQTGQVDLHLLGRADAQLLASVDLQGGQAADLL